MPDWTADAAVIIAALSMFGLLLRQIGPWRAQITKTEERLRAELVAERARCEAELRLVRHRERGSRQLIYSLLHAINMPPGAKRDGALESIHATLTELERVEAMEAGLIVAAVEQHLEERDRT